MVINIGLDLGTTIGIIISVVIVFWQMQRNRFDKYLEEVSSEKYYMHRKEIFRAYCKLSCPDKLKPKQFLELLRDNEELRDKCQLEIALFERAKNSIPLWPFLRRNALSYIPNSIVLLWMIMSEYIKDRRKNYSSVWASNFIKISYISIKKVKLWNEGGIMLLDPDNMKSIKITKTMLQDMYDDLKNEKERSFKKSK